VNIVWTGPSNDGGSAVINYEIQWDQGTGSWTSLNTVTSATTNELVLTLTTGGTYKFMIASENLYGWSSYSSVLEVLIGDIPD
jgi:hypothetical protein